MGKGSQDEGPRAKERVGEHRAVGKVKKEVETKKKEMGGLGD